jgi:hypothetical protein
VLNRLIACWCCGPNNSSLLSIEACIFPTASLTIVEEKLGTDPWIGQPSCCGSGWQPLFSVVVDLFESVDNYVKSCYARTV